jgi:type II secretory pathway pseudopilin PulG
MRTSRTGNNIAFTIVEVLVVVAMLTVLATMIVPRLGDAAASRRLRQSAGQLLATARYARDYASTHRASCRLMIDAKNNQYVLARQIDPERRPSEFEPVTDAPGRVERLLPPVQVARVWVEPRPRFGGVPAPSDAITFDPMGQADAANVQLTDGRQTYSLLTSPSTGQVRLVEGAVNELPLDRQDLDD